MRREPMNARFFYGLLIGLMVVLIIVIVADPNRERVPPEPQRHEPSRLTSFAEVLKPP